MRFNLKIVLSIIILLGAFAAAYILYFKFLGNPLSSSNAGLSVTSSYGQATVILDGALAGKTPYKSDTLKPGDHTLSIKGENGSYETTIKLVPQAETVISREAGVGGDFSAGYSVWMEKVSSKEISVSVVSDPQGALVKVDSEEKGETPLTLTEISVGNHTIEVSKKGYESQLVYLKFKEGFKLNIISDLFLIPLPESLEGIDYSSAIKVYNLVLPQIESNIDTLFWAKAIYYYGKTRGNPISFDYLIDSAGRIYDSLGVEVLSDKDILPKETIIVGYMASSRGDLSDKAKEALSKFGAPAATEVIKIIPTGVGWLRVRSEPSLNSSEISKVNVGEQFAVIEKSGTWIKIKLSDGGEGWVSAAYTEKVEE